jgi:hypothetical protein
MNIEDFQPSLRNIAGNHWEAYIRLPVVGDVTVTGDGWPDAKFKLWLVAVVVERLSLASKECGEPAEWTEEEWRSVMKSMAKLERRTDEIPPPLTNQRRG